MSNVRLTTECTDRGQKATHKLTVICRDDFALTSSNKIFFLFLKHAIRPRMALNKVSPASTIRVKGFGYILSCTHSYLSRCSQTPKGVRCPGKGDPGGWESAIWTQEINPGPLEEHKCS